MNTLRTLLTDDHRHCDDLLSDVEAAVAAGDAAAALAAFAPFRDTTLAHFAAEENLLFPAFERQTGMTQGPTAVMRGEHERLRALLADIEAALRDQRLDDYEGQIETCLIMLQQHNMKEENVLYPMCDMHLEAERPRLLTDLGNALGSA